MIQNLMNMDSDPKMREAWNRVPFKVQVSFIIRSQVEDVNLVLDRDSNAWKIVSADEFQKIMKKEERLRKKAEKKAKKEKKEKKPESEVKPEVKPVETPEAKPEVKPE